MFPDFEEDELDDEVMSGFVYMAENLVEHRLNTAHAVVIKHDEQFRKVSSQYNWRYPKESLERMYSYLLSCAENPPKVMGDLYHFGHF